MRDYRFNYIITIHNKESLIEKVLQGVLASCGNNSFIYPVLDGCSDNSEEIIDRISKKTKTPIIKVYQSDVHEILSLNSGLRAASQIGFGFNILLQDDVILSEPNLEKNVICIYNTLGYNNIGVLAFRHGVNLSLDFNSKEIKEEDLIENYFSSGYTKSILPPSYLVKRMVGVRSPECISFDVINKIGLFDEKLAPYTYDNHDYSIRCLINGYENFVYSLEFNSEVKWGGMRQNPHDGVKNIMTRNRKYLFGKHFDFLNAWTSNYENNLKPQPFKIRGLENNNDIIKSKVMIFFRVVEYYLFKFKQLIN